MNLIKKYCGIILFLVPLWFVSCGGAAPAAACTVPYEIQIYRQANGEVTQTRKDSPDSEPVIVKQGQGADIAVLPCAGQGTQWFSFDMKTTNYFSGGGDHIIAATNALFDLAVPSYLARGVIMSPKYGLLAERMALGYGSLHSICQNSASSVNGVHCNANMQRVYPMQFFDETTYHLTMHSVATHIAYTIGDISNAWMEGYDHVNLNGNSIAIGVICENTCIDKVFSTKFTNISAGWF